MIRERILCHLGSDNPAEKVRPTNTKSAGRMRKTEAALGEMEGYRDKGTV